MGKLRAHMQPSCERTENERVFRKITIGKRIFCYWRKGGWFPLKIISLREVEGGWQIVGQMDNGQETEEFLIMKEGFGYFWKEV